MPCHHHTVSQRSGQSVPVTRSIELNLLDLRINEINRRADPSGLQRSDRLAALTSPHKQEAEAGDSLVQAAAAAAAVPMLYSWGRGEDGQCGNGDTNDQVRLMEDRVGLDRWTESNSGF